MGRVFLGTDSNGRQAAVKVVRSDLADVPAFRKRFKRELDVALRVHSPRVAEIYDARTDGELPWLATEFVPGPTLQDAVDQGGGFDNQRLRALAVAIAEALQVIHAVEVVHRDLKPANVLLGPDGPKVIDFGVARALDASLLTNTGQTLGTPAYMSPEQADGRSVHSASDVFALGSLLVFAATGRLAFGDGPPLAILHRVVNNDPDLEGVAEDDAELREIIEGCLAKEAEDRPTPQRIIDTFGAVRWPPLTGIAWQKPVLGVGLPLTAGEAADQPTVALGPKRPGKRIAVISAATVAMLILATIALVEGPGGGGGSPLAQSSRNGDSIPNADPVGGGFPSSNSGSDSGSSSGSATTPNSNGAPKPPAGSPASVNPGGGSAPPSGNSTSVLVGGGQQTSGGGAVTHPTTYIPPTSKPTTHPSSVPPPSPPAHNPPAAPTGVSAYIPPWFGEATVDASWNAQSDATSYVLEYTIDSGSPQYIPTSGTTASYMLPAGSTSCIQVQAVNQYGKSAFAPSPPVCFNSAAQPVGS